MKKLFIVATVFLSVLSTQVKALNNVETEMLNSEFTRYLSSSDREQKIREIHACITFSRNHLEKAKKEIRKISNPNTQNMISSAIEGAICGLSGGSCYSVAIAGALGCVGSYAHQMTDCYFKIRSELEIAHGFASKADRLQDELWRG